MSKDQWSSEWSNAPEGEKIEWPKPDIKSNIDFGGIELKKYNNRMPTHDPYVNPDSHIYYQCGCGAILDPGTKSFASLNNAASSQGWKVRWNKNGEGYQPFCVKCGEGVE